MSGGSVFRYGLSLAACVLAGSGVAQARIAQTRPDYGAVPNVLGSDGLNGYYSRIPAAPAPGEVTKTITLNFGPLHFQEVLKSAPKTCRS